MYWPHYTANIYDHIKTMQYMHSLTVQITIYRQLTTIDGCNVYSKMTMTDETQCMTNDLNLYY